MTGWTLDARSDPLPPSLDAVLGLVMADLQQPSAVDVVVRYASNADLLWVAEPDGGGWTGLPIADAGGDAWHVVQLAGQLQEQFFLESAGAWGEARPRCPGHPHPAEADLVGGEAVWICPADRRRLAAIGALAGAAG